jgi:hypothetical protein
MLTGRQAVASASLFLFATALCSAQNIAPAHSGTIHYFDGDVTVDGVKLESKVARFDELKEKSVLHTSLGRAEILLTPGVFLRVAENSSVRMLDNRLLSTRVELISGSAMVESDDPGTSVKDPAVTIVYKDFQLQPVRYSVFEISSEPSQMRVYKGEAKAMGNGGTVNVKDGNLVSLNMTMATAKFDAKAVDDLYVWSRDRSSYLSAGNMSSARSLNSSMSNGFSGSGWSPYLYSGFSGGWYYNSYLGMYSFMPFAGTVYSPFGFGIYNPVTIGYIYDPAYYWGGSGGARTSTTSGLPLSHISTVSAAAAGHPQQLPRLSFASNLHPTLSSPARGTEPAFSMANSAPLAARNNNGLFGGNVPQSSSPTGLTAAPSASPAMSAPVMAAPAAGAAASAPARLGGAARR